ncbi:MAG: thymidine kinase [archaeon]|jgi:thymidine kinase
MTGILITIVGPMFSGKTTELLRLMDRELIAKRNSILFKPQIDNRYSEEDVLNHNGVGRKAIIANNSHDIWDKTIELNKQKAIENIFIDEIQFFDSNITEVINKINNLGIDVYTCGLNQTFKGEPFPFKDGKKDIGYLMAISDQIISLDAICNMCGEKATKTYRTGTDTATVVVGGQDKYQARCKNCFKL